MQEAKKHKENRNSIRNATQLEDRNQNLGRTLAWAQKHYEPKPSIISRGGDKFWSKEKDIQENQTNPLH